jgi:CspA family cold shock protein
MSMTSGTVKWYNESKGFGFIKSESGEEVFFERSAIKTEAQRALKEGQRVEFDVEQGRRGPKAVRVTLRQ